MVLSSDLELGETQAVKDRRLWRVVLLCAVVAFAQYVVTIDHGFVLDDASSVIGTTHTTEGVQLPLFEATVNGQGKFFRPFGYLGFSIDYAIWEMNPSGYHFTCVFLHVLATAAFVVLASQLVSLGPALIAGLLFAVHPVHVEAVANIWNRTGVQSTFFVFCALIAWLRIQHVWLRVVVVNVLAFIAVGSKEGAVALPVALTAIIWLRRGGRFDLKPALACTPAFLLWFGLRRAALGEQPTFGELFTDQELMVRLYTMGELLAHNARVLVWPMQLRADYSQPTTTMLSSVTGFSILGWCLTLSLSLGLVIAIRRRHWSALGLGLLVATIWPFLHVFVPLGVPLAERWLYLPSAGLCLVIGESLWRARAVLIPSVQRGLIAGLVVCFALLTTLRALEWESPMTLWEADASKANASAFTWGNYSLSLWGVGRHGDALKAMMHARNLNPEWTVYGVKYQEMRSMLRTEPDTAEDSSTEDIEK